MNQLEQLALELIEYEDTNLLNSWIYSLSQGLDTLIRNMGNEIYTDLIRNGEDFVMESHQGVLDIIGKDEHLASFIITRISMIWSSKSHKGQVESEAIPNLYDTLVENSFHLEEFECEICFETKSGIECHKMSNCGHVFCHDCLSGYFDSKIQDGDTSFTCPNPTCGENISQRDIQIHVERDKFNRFERLQFNRALDTMDDIAYCPKPDCRTQTVKWNLESTNVQCGQCGFNYCTDCEKDAHTGECKHTDEELEIAAQELDRCANGV